MAVRGLVDISQTLSAATPCWPGDTRFASETVWRIGPDCPVEVARFGCSTHAGTHADAPSHYDPDGASIDAVPLEPFLGPARLLDLRGCGVVVTPAMLQPALDRPTRRLLLRTYDCFPHDSWRDEFTTIDADAIALPLRLAGLDAAPVRAVLRPLSR